MPWSRQSPDPQRREIVLYVGDQSGRFTQTLVVRQFDPSAGSPPGNLEKIRARMTSGTTGMPGLEPLRVLAGAWQFPGMPSSIPAPAPDVLSVARLRWQQRFSTRVRVMENLLACGAENLIPTPAADDDE